MNYARAFSMQERSLKWMPGASMCSGPEVFRVSSDAKPGDVHYLCAVCKAFIEGHGVVSSAGELDRRAENEERLGNIALVQPWAVGVRERRK